MGFIALNRIEGYELLTQKVYKVLKEAILKGDISKGERLVELQIARQLGTSRTPVREAIHRLAMEGLVELVPNQGAFVAGISLRDVEEVFQIRSVLEGLAVKLFALRWDEGKMMELESKLCEMRKAIGKGDIVSYADSDSKFHRLLWLFSGNNRLLKVLDSVVPYIDAYRLRSLHIPGVMEKSFEDHLNLVDLLKRRDAEGAEILMRKHVERVLERVLNMGREEH